VVVVVVEVVVVVVVEAMYSHRLSGALSHVQESLSLHCIRPKLGQSSLTGTVASIVTISSSVLGSSGSFGAYFMQVSNTHDK